jgi:eukaryotic translation initiation factor 2C
LAYTLKLSNSDMLVLTSKCEMFRDDREYKVTIRYAGRADLAILQQFLLGKMRDLPQEAIQALDVVLRESPSLK